MATLLLLRVKMTVLKTCRKNAKCGLEKWVPLKSGIFVIGKVGHLFL